MRYKAGIVGGGFSGTMAALQLLRHGVRDIILIEARREPATGLAYATDEPWHLLNVPARNMSAFPDDPGHFARWLEREHGLGADSFAQRRQYRAYLRHLWETKAEGRLTLVRGQACALLAEREGASLLLADGSRVHCAALVLAGGNLPPRRPPLRDAAAGAGIDYIADPWSPEGPAGLRHAAMEEQDILILGTGLTMVDVALTLHGLGFRGRMTAASRRGLVPRVHAPYDPDPVSDPQQRLPGLLRETRDRAAHAGWRAAVDALRPHSALLWQGFTRAERGRFVRHLRPYWDVHRHRIAPQVGAALDQMIREERLEILAGRVRGIEEGDVLIAPRGGGATLRRKTGTIVNCTGPGRDIADADDPLVRQLIGSGRARPDPLGIGLDVDEGSRLIDAQGRACPNIFVLGPLTRGRSWEIVAVPDIRGQAAQVAADLAAALPRLSAPAG